MSFEGRLEERRRAAEVATSTALEIHQQELARLQEIHEAKRNNPIFIQMRELASSSELTEALLAYYETYRNREGEAEILVSDTFDTTLIHKEDEPYGLINITMPISDPYSVSGGDADPVTITDELKVTIRGVRSRKVGQEFRIFSSVGRESIDGSGGKFSSYYWEEVLNNIADRIISGRG